MQHNSPTDRRNPKHDEIVALIEQGKTNGQVAMACRVSLGVVAGIRARYKNPPGLIGWPDDDIRVLRKLVKWKWPVRAIAQALGKSRRAVTAKMHREGLTFAKVSEPRSFA